MSDERDVEVGESQPARTSILGDQPPKEIEMQQHTKGKSIESETEGAAPGQALSPTPSGGAGASDMNTEYLNYLITLRKHWTDCPSVEIIFKDLCYKIHNDATIADAHSAVARRKRAEASASGTTIASKAEENIPNLAKATAGILMSPITISQRVLAKITKAEVPPEEVVTALAPISGTIKPGSMTLILAPPGAGKSTFLRALTGRLNGDSGLSGEVYFNGLTVSECLARGIHVTRLCSYVGQSDISFPVLTVEETLEFARMNGVGDVKLLRKDPNTPNTDLEAMDAKRSTLLMELLGMMECKDTIIGSDLMRGISGGQKKRAAIGESLMSNARLYALDEVSNGLDSAVTLHIFNALKSACEMDSSSVITALQQVTPETYALFDSLILMREGRVVYHGPRTEVRGWLKDVMNVPFIPDSLEEAGFLIDLLSDPKQAMEKASVAWKVQMKQQQEKKDSTPPMMSMQPATELPEDSNASGNRHPKNSVSHRAESGVDQVRFHLYSDADAPIANEELQDSPDPQAGDALLMNGHKSNGYANGNGNGKHANGASSPSPQQQKQQLGSMSDDLNAEDHLNNHSDPHSAQSPFKRSVAELEPLLDVEQLMQLSLDSKYGQRSLKQVDAALSKRTEISSQTMDVTKWSAYTSSQYGRQFPHSTLFHTALCCSRQVKLTARNLTFVVPRIFNAVLMGLVYGTLFFQLSESDFASKLGLIQNGVMFVAFANFQELPVAAEGKQVVVRQVDAGFYPAVSYGLAVNLVTAPLAIMETLVFGTILYFIPGFVTEADRYFFWLFLLFSCSSAMSQLFRMITYIAGNADVAQQMNMPFVMLFVVFGGFLIPLSKINDWLVWIYYLSPFSWATDSLALNEFRAGQYSDPDPDDPSRTVGDSYVAAFGLRQGLEWKWFALIYLWGFYVVLSTVSMIVLSYSSPTVAMGAKRGLAYKKKEVDHDAVVVNVAPSAEGSNGNNNVEGKQKRLGGNTRSSAGNKASFQLAALPFQPATLAWKDIKYTVYIGKEKTPKVLLNHISGFAEPGKLTALMGSSGAGKTTLMDVIAGRKTTGLIEFDSNIFVNGKPKDDTFERITGYVEQTDLHVGTATVKEALEFSARLRLPVSVSSETREAFINEVMELVGITGIQNRMIGDVAQPSLSTGQLKLLTVAVELVANPSILFLDEPTTSLDSKSAFRVMRAIKRIAATGRTIVCTIHQPSQEVFFMFDKLLLLRRGGETVYFDDIGQQGDKLVNYMTRVSRNLIPYTQLVSPANWMLDVISLDATSLVLEEEKQQEEKKKEEEETGAAKKKLKASGSSANANGAKLQAINEDPVSLGAKPSPHLTSSGSSASSDHIKDVFRQKVLAAQKSSATAKFTSFQEKKKTSSAGIIEEEDVDDTPIQFSEEWSKSAEAGAAMKEVDRYSSPASHAGASSTAEKNEYISDAERLWHVVIRGYISHWRSPPVNVTRCILMGIIGFFLGAVYYQTRVDDFEGMSALLAAVFLGVSIPSSICSEASMSTFFRQRAVYYRESSVKMYGYLIYTASLSIIELPYLFLGQFFFVLPFYFLTGLSTDGNLFFKFILAGFVMILFFSFLNQIFLAALPNLVAAQALNGLTMSISFAFGGLFIKASAIPIGWKWFYYIDPIPKSFIASMLTQLSCPNYSPEYTGDERINGCRIINIPGTGNVQAYKYASDLLEGSTDSYWPMIGWMILTIGFIRLVSVYLFKTVSHLER